MALYFIPLQQCMCVLPVLSMDSACFARELGLLQSPDFKLTDWGLVGWNMNFLSWGLGEA